MKTISTRRTICLLITIWCAAVRAAVISTYDYSGASVTVPDNNASGVAFGFSFSGAGLEITDVTVTLNVSGGFNGDLYAYLSHGSGFTVLLNRVGVGETTPGSSASGYLNTGFAITFNAAAAANVHFYQNNSPTYNGNGQLTGTWLPDGRVIDPGSAPSAFDAAGTAGFGSFTGINPNGDWTLFISDSSPGGISTLEDFSVQVSAVPEPVNAALMVFGSLVAGCCLIRRRRSRAVRPTSTSKWAT